LKNKAEMKTEGNGHSKLCIPDPEIEMLARCFLPAVREYYETEEGKRAFAEWEREHGGGGER
jgi:hypothetical protein